MSIKDTSGHTKELKGQKNLTRMKILLQHKVQKQVSKKKKYKMQPLNIITTTGV